MDREGEGGMIWENRTETCIISYMKRITSPGSMHDTGCLGLVHWEDAEGCYGDERIIFFLVEIMASVVLILINRYCKILKLGCCEAMSPRVG